MRKEVDASGNTASEQALGFDAAFSCLQFGDKATSDPSNIGETLLIEAEPHPGLSHEITDIGDRGDYSAGLVVLAWGWVDWRRVR